MKKVFMAGCALCLALTASHSFAQMGGGMMGGGMGRQGQMMEHGGTMGDNPMMGDMQGMMDRMSGMMGNMQDGMRQMSPGQRKDMSDMMGELSGQMMEMSRMMERGTMSESEIKTMKDRMDRMQKRLSRPGMER